MHSLHKVFVSAYPQRRISFRHTIKILVRDKGFEPSRLSTLVIVGGEDGIRTHTLFQADDSKSSLSTVPALPPSFFYNMYLFDYDSWDIKIEDYPSCCLENFHLCGLHVKQVVFEAMCP